MRESIGASWMLGIVVVFIFLFLFFISYSINYTRAFNIKNEIINYIEHAEGFTKVDGDIETADLTSKRNKDTVQAKALDLIRRTGYDYATISAADCQKQDLNAELFAEGGYCIVKVCQDPDNKVKNTYYKVTAFISMKVPLINLSVNIPVTGQTRTIYQDNSNYECKSS